METQTTGMFLRLVYVVFLYVCASNGDKGDIFMVVLGRYILESKWIIIEKNINGKKWI